MKKMQKQKNKGITLIALVITIIVLLILAGVTIATLTGENGVLTRASEASEQTKQASSEEQVQLAIAGSVGTNGNIEMEKLNEGLKDIENLKYNSNLITEENQIEKLPAIVDVEGTEIAITGDGETLKVSTIEEIKNNVYVEETTLVKDINNKNIILPGGFTIRVDESTSNADSIEEGIVIEDQEGNQYVWIPVEGILGEDGKTVQDAVDGEIILGRYSFDINNNGIINTNLTPTRLGGELKRNSYETNSYIEEKRENGNVAAQDIESFIESIRINKGYYIARFEASEGVNGKIEIKYDKKAIKKGQKEASEYCLNLYENISSDLINSYAWDTAILFIQKFGQSNYAAQSSLNDIHVGELNTGKSNDIQCNIYDMASNNVEWSTETTTSIKNPLVYRGGTYNGSATTAGYRVMRETTTVLNLGFRPILYI